MKFFIATAWSDARANYNTSEWDTAADAAAAVEVIRHRFEKQGFEPVGITVQPKSKYTSECRVFNYRQVVNGLITIHSCGYWSQDIDQSADRNPGHCEASYLGCS